MNYIETMMLTDEELYHYGVKGMKWGVRRKRDISDFNTKNVKTEVNSRGRITSAGDYTVGSNKGVFRGQDRRAVKRAMREKKAYTKAVNKSGGKYSEKKAQAVAGNKYISEIESIKKHNTQVGNKKRAKIDVERSYLNKDNSTQKSTISEGVKTRNALKAERLPMQSRKANIDKKLESRNNYWTQMGYENDQKISKTLSEKISKIERLELSNDAKIASAIHKMDLNNKKLSELNSRYDYIGRSYLGL